MKQKFQTFLISPAGSVVKVFVAIMLGILLKEYKEGNIDIFDLSLSNLKTVIGAAFTSCVPMIINFLNPSHTAYGIGKEEQ